MFLRVGACGFRRVAQNARFGNLGWLQLSIGRSLLCSQHV